MDKLAFNLCSEIQKKYQNRENKMAAISAAAAAKPYKEWISGNDPDASLINALLADILKPTHVSFPYITVRKMENGTDLLITVASRPDEHIIMQPSGAISPFKNTTHPILKNQCENYNLGMGIEFLE